MISDFEPIVHRMDGRTIKVWAVADVHIGARNADVDGFKAFIKRVQADEDSYIVIVGDLMENNTRDSVSDYGYLPPSAQVDLAVELLQPVADRILGVVGGNHEFRTTRATDLDPLYAVCLMLRANGESLAHLYRQNFAFLRIVLERGRVADRYALMLIHGKTANKKRHFAYAVEGVDAIISGHTHDGLVEKPAKLVFTPSNNVRIQPLVSITATSWLPFSDYAARSLCLPKATSCPQYMELEFTGSNSSEGAIKVVW